MAKEFFFGYIGSLLACSIILAVVVKNLAEGIAVSGKKPYLYGSGLAILTSLAAFLASFISKDPFEVFWFLGAIFFLLGIIHMLFLHERFFYTNKRNSNKVLLAEVLFGLSVIFFTIVVFSALQYYFKDPEFLFYPVVISTLLFFVPLLVYHSFQAAYEIPPAHFPTWQYPLNMSIEPPDIEGERVIIIGFEVAKYAGDSRKDYFRVRAHETWQLGTLFYHFLNEYNDPNNRATIEYIGKEGETFDWWFYKKHKWYQVQKILNPEFSLRESRITENTVIVCERLLNYTPASKTYNTNYHER